MKDFTIEVWAVSRHNFSQCTCSWLATADDSDLLLRMVERHRKCHADKGEFTEIV